MSRGDFAAALRKADSAMAARTMPAAADRRVLDRLRRAAEDQGKMPRRPGFEDSRTRTKARPPLRLVIPAFACLAALALLVAIGLRARPGETTAAATDVGGFLLLARSADLDLVAQDGVVELRRGRCTLRDPQAAMTLELAGQARVRRDSGGVRLDRGTVEFAVDPNGRGRHVAVSHGEIRITGTRFTVEQRDDGGRVDLHEGGIEFLSEGREALAVRPGQSLAWPLPPTPATVEPPPPPAPIAPVASSAPPRASVATSASAAAPGDLLARIEALRSQGRYAEAAELAASSGKSSSETRERLSYERGGLLTYQLRDAERGCAHWQRHLQEFPNGRYAVEVQRARQSLGCR